MEQMDIRAEKLEFIRWLAGINDSRVIKQLKTLQKYNQEEVSSILTDAEKLAIDQGLKTIKEGKTHSHEDVMKSARIKYPNLFK